MSNRGKLIIFSAPSGSGKSTLINYLMQQGLPFSFSVSATSRAPRGSEQHGKEYYFLTEEEINSFCQAMPRYKRPRKVFFDKVPRNPTGKIEKPVLREKYCGKRLVEAQITG